MKKSRKIWIGVGAFVLAGTGASLSPAVAQDSPAPAAQRDTRAAASHGIGDVPWQLAQAKPNAGGEGGEGGQGGEGGEAGINVENAAKDPVEYGVALQVIAAHYHAGLAAYAGNEQEAGAQMFAHGLSEVYAEMEALFKKLGVNDLGPALQATVDAAVAKKPLADVRKQARLVFLALSAAEKRTPKSALSPRAVKSQVTAAMIDRAAAQYAVVQKDKALEAYLDGLGFAMAAQTLSRDVLPWIRQQDVRKEKAMRQALSVLKQAYPGIQRPEKPATTEAQVLSAASGAKLAVSGLR